MITRTEYTDFYIIFIKFGRKNTRQEAGVFYIFYSCHH